MKKGILAVIGTYSIFGLNIVFCKDLTASGVIGPAALFSVRAVGATVLFWLLSLLLPAERVDKKDFPRLFAASFIGILLPQLCTMVGITMSTPFDAAVIYSCKPVITAIVVSIMMKSRIGLKTISGVLVSLLGALTLIYFGKYDSFFRTTPLGLVLLITNGVLFSIYLVAFRDLISKYTPVTFMKWVFLFAIVPSLFFSIGQFRDFRVESLSSSHWFELGFSVILATFVSYFLAPVGQKRLQPVQYSVFSYTQLVVASAVGIIMGLELFRWEKVIAAILLISGTWIVCATKKETVR